MARVIRRQSGDCRRRRIPEALWSDLAADDESFASPTWHEDALRATEADFAAGRIEVLDWEDAKKQLRKRSE